MATNSGESEDPGPAVPVGRRIGNPAVGRVATSPSASGTPSNGVLRRFAPPRTWTPGGRADGCGQLCRRDVEPTTVVGSDPAGPACAGGTGRAGGAADSWLSGRRGRRTRHARRQAERPSAGRRGSRDRPSRSHLFRAAGVGRFRPGSAGGGARVRRAYGPALTAGEGGERQFR